MVKIKQWIVAHKLWSIVIASVLVVAVSLSVALPLALRHKHTYSEEWSTDASYHWRVCTGEDCDSTSDKAEHTFVEEHSDTQYWQECSVCGYQKEKIDAKVANNEVLRHALFFKDAESTPYTNLVAVCEGYNTSGEVSKNVKYTENAYYIYDSNNNGTSLPKEKMYVKETDGTKATYSKMNENAGWTRVVETHSDNYYMYAKSAIFIYGVNDFTFEYNQADSTYVATKDNDSGTETTKYIIKFANGKIISAVLEEINISTQNTSLRYAWTISYGNATIEVPTEITAVTAAQWNKALSFDGVTNYTLSSQGGVNSQVTKVTSTQASQETTNSAGKTNILVCDTVGHNRYLKGFSSEKFTITNIPTLDATVMMNMIGGKPGNRYSAILDSFASFEYKADEKVFYIASATIGGNTCTDVKLTFDNGKLIKTEYTYDGNNITLTYTYGDAVVTIPSDSECITPIAYNSTNGNFVLSNATLKASETKTFVIKISQDVFEANDASGKCEISGEFTTTGTISSIVVKDANGTTIDNIASEKNEFDCEISAAGKYYIEITADAECTGAWDIGFVDITPTPAAGSTKETAIAINWSSTDSKFILNNIALSTTDTWLVLEITETTHSSYKKTSGKYELDGAVTLGGESDATLTIVAENESGTEITNNKSSDNCKLNLTLDAGKYYIKISANKDCTGALSIEFKTGKIDL